MKVTIFDIYVASFNALASFLGIDFLLNIRIKMIPKQFHFTSILRRACLVLAALFVFSLQIVFFKLEFALPCHMLMYSKA